MHHVLNQLTLSVEPNEFVASWALQSGNHLAIAGLLLSAVTAGRFVSPARLLTGLNQGQWTQNGWNCSASSFKITSPLLYENR